MTEAEVLYGIRNVTKSFAKPRGGNKVALDIELLTIPGGKLVAIVGGTASGKTTLLNVLGGLEAAEPRNSFSPQLAIRVPPVFHNKLSAEVDFAASVPAALACSISFIFQETYLLDTASVQLNLAIARESAGLRFNQEVMHSALAQANLNDVEDYGQRASTLSGGQKDRLGLARALIREPFLILADEVTGSLDPDTALSVVQALKAWTGPGRSVLWVTHDYELALHADCIVAMRDGRPLSPEPTPIEEFRGDKNRIHALVTVEQPVAIAKAQSPSATRALRHQSRRRSLANGLRLARYEMFQPESKGAPRYKQGASSIMSFLLLLLATVCYLVWIDVGIYFNGEINNPRLRHLVVAGNVDKNEWPIKAETFERLDKGLAEGRLPGAETRSAFGRIVGIQVPMSFVDGSGEGEPVGDSVDGLILRLDVNEPLSKVLQVNAADSRKTVLFDLMKTAPPFSIVLDPLVWKKLEKRNPDLDRTTDRTRISLKRNGNWQTFTVSGLSDEQIVDRGDFFDGILSLDQHVEWMSQVDPGELSSGHIPSYERVAVYFDKTNYEHTQRYLRTQDFIFDKSNLEKLVRLLNVSSRINWSLAGLIMFVGAVICAVAWYLVNTYLKANEKRLAVLEAHGVSNFLPMASILIQVLTGWMMAMRWLICLLAVFFGLIYLGVLRTGPAGNLWSARSPQQLTDLPYAIEAFLPALATLAIMLVTTVWTYLVWKPARKNLAETLRRS
jgi:putative ABC transport system ATP-binding protein